MGSQVPCRCCFRLLSPWASPSQLVAAATNASDILQIIVLPAQLIPATASTRNPPSIAALSGQHRAITSHNCLSNDCHTYNQPTDDRFTVDCPTDDCLTDDQLAVNRPTNYPLIEPIMAPIESTLTLIKKTTAPIIKPTTAPVEPATALIIEPTAPIELMTAFIESTMGPIKPTTASIIEPTMDSIEPTTASIEPTMAPIEFTMALIIKPKTAPI